MLAGGTLQDATLVGGVYNASLGVVFPITKARDTTYSVL